jgi:two-component system cell cycle response regulator
MARRRNSMSEGTVPERRGADRVRVASILVVDDSSTIRRILRRDLEAAGYRVTEAPDGEVGLAACRALRPDLVLLDVDMPVLDGMDTLERMQADPDLRHLPVLFLTARTSGGEAARGLEMGAHDYLKKPCDQAELLARVSTVLRQKARERGLRSRAEELAELSTTDALTGVGNRRRLEQQLATLRPERPLGVLIVDLDLFKQVNDREGHLVGDAVLAVVAARLRAVCDVAATVARWGGEEFVVLAPDADAHAVAGLGERLRAAVGESPLAVGGLDTLRLTVSIGAASGQVRDFEALLQAADSGLYSAKAAGRNRVAIGTVPSP